MIEKEMNIERLRADYKGAFDEWALQVNRRRQVIDTDGEVAKEAEERVEVAQSAYRETRDRLAKSYSDTRSQEPGEDVLRNG